MPITAPLEPGDNEENNEGHANGFTKCYHSKSFSSCRRVSKKIIHSKPGEYTLGTLVSVGKITASAGDAAFGIQKFFENRFGFHDVTSEGSVPSCSVAKIPEEKIANSPFIVDISLGVGILTGIVTGWSRVPAIMRDIRGEVKVNRELDWSLYSPKEKRAIDGTSKFIHVNSYFSAIWAGFNAYLSGYAILQLCNYFIVLILGIDLLKDEKADYWASLILGTYCLLSAYFSFKAFAIPQAKNWGELGGAAIVEWCREPSIKPSKLLVATASMSFCMIVANAVKGRFSVYHGLKVFPLTKCWTDEEQLAVAYLSMFSTVVTSVFTRVAAVYQLNKDIGHWWTQSRNRGSFQFALNLPESKKVKALFFLLAVAGAVDVIATMLGNNESMMSLIRDFDVEPMDITGYKRWILEISVILLVNIPNGISQYAFTVQPMIEDFLRKHRQKTPAHLESPGDSEMADFESVSQNLIPHGLFNGRQTRGVHLQIGRSSQERDLDQEEQDQKRDLYQTQRARANSF